MTQQCGDRRKIDVLDEASGRVVAEPMRVDVWHIGATAQHPQRVADAAVGVRTVLAPENWSVG